MIGKKSNSEDNNRQGELNTIIGKESTIEGNIKVKNSLRIDGQIKGGVISTETVTIGADGLVEGDIQAKEIILGGRVIGNLSSTGRIILENQARLSGDLCTRKLIIDEGAVFEGNCKMEDGTLTREEGKKKEGVAKAGLSPE
ncbi:polymer-forming cytoskeletal protein [candidate division KSB1 bacterium]|nr:polymer-forming cytoskeletal protein [candidate division KSB1 bacterium]